MHFDPWSGARDFVEQAIEPVIKSDKKEPRSHTNIMKEIANCVLWKGLTFQDIERFLREKNSSTYLIANRNIPGYKSEIGLDCSKIYNISISINGKNEAMRQIGEESISYDDNFEKLNNTGFLLQNPDESVNVPVMDQIKNEEKLESSSQLRLLV